MNNTRDEFTELIGEKSLSSFYNIYFIRTFISLTRGENTSVELSNFFSILLKRLSKSKLEHVILEKSMIFHHNRLSVNSLILDFIENIINDVGDNKLFDFVCASNRIILKPTIYMQNFFLRINYKVILDYLDELLYIDKFSRELEIIDIHYNSSTIGREYIRAVITRKFRNDYHNSLSKDENNDSRKSLSKDEKFINNKIQRSKAEGNIQNYKFINPHLKSEKENNISLDDLVEYKRNQKRG